MADGGCGEAAVAAGDDRLALRAAVALIYSDGYQRERYEQGGRTDHVEAPKVDKL